MDIKFEHDYQKKVIYQEFTGPTSFDCKKDVLKWRSRWTNELSTWHSPYKALINLDHVTAENSEEVKSAFEVMERFLKGLFLKKTVGFSQNASTLDDILPFPVFPTRQEAEEVFGVRIGRSGSGDDFRSSISFENHFQHHVIELTFDKKVNINTKKLLAIFKSKLTNNLMHWHSAWSLLVDCSNLEFDPTLEGEWQKMERFFNGFFLKKTVGYGIVRNKENYPFPVYRARHKATSQLEAEGLTSGQEADCNSRKATGE